MSSFRLDLPYSFHESVSVFLSGLSNVKCFEIDTGAEDAEDTGECDC